MKCCAGVKLIKLSGSLSSGSLNSLLKLRGNLWCNALPFMRFGGKSLLASNMASTSCHSGLSVSNTLLKSCSIIQIGQMTPKMEHSIIRPEKSSIQTGSIPSELYISLYGGTISTMRKLHYFVW